MRTLATTFLVIVFLGRLFGAINSPTASPNPQPRPERPLVCKIMPSTCVLFPRPVPPKPKPEPIQPMPSH